MFTEVVNMCYWQRRAIFIDPYLDHVTRNKKTMYFTEAMKFLVFRTQHFVTWAQASVYEKFVIPCNSRSSTVSFFRSFLMLLSSFLLQLNCFFLFLRIWWNISVKEIFSFQKQKLSFSKILFQKKPPHVSLILLF